MKTFHVQTLGCKVNHYESEQIATLLRSRGLTATDAGSADLRVINTCSVTTQAASQSRQSVRRMVRLPVLSNAASSSSSCSAATIADALPLQSAQSCSSEHLQVSAKARSRVLVTGCWATSNHSDASALSGVDAVVDHHQNVAVELDRLIHLWTAEETPDDTSPTALTVATSADACMMPSKTLGIEFKRKDETATPAGQCTTSIEPKPYETVNEEMWGGERTNEHLREQTKVDDRVGTKGQSDGATKCENIGESNSRIGTKGRSDEGDEA